MVSAIVLIECHNEQFTEIVTGQMLLVPGITLSEAL